MTIWELLALAQAGKALKKASDASVLRWKGSVSTYSALPNDAAQGDVYHVDADGEEYAWDGTGWEPLGEIVTVDNALSDTSENPVQNKVVKSAIDAKLQAVELTMEQYEALTSEQKNNGTLYLITDADTLPDANEVSF